jgi:hypothetical protein
MHCGGGAGPSAFNTANGSFPRPPSNHASDDLFVALSTWVEDGVAPSEVIATTYVGGAPDKGVAMQRPLCAWPDKAWYKGSGDTNDAKNFACAMHRPDVSHSKT